MRALPGTLLIAVLRYWILQLPLGPLNLPRLPSVRVGTGNTAADGPFLAYTCSLAHDWGSALNLPCIPESLYPAHETHTTEQPALRIGRMRPVLSSGDALPMGDFAAGRYGLKLSAKVLCQRRAFTSQFGWSASAA